MQPTANPLDQSAGDLPQDEISVEDRVAPLIVSAASAYADAYHGGDLANLDPDDVYEMSAVASLRPELCAIAMGDDPSVALNTTPAAMRDAMLNQYEVACLGQMYDELKEESRTVPVHMKMQRREAMFSYSRVSPDTAGHIMFDAENGDDTAMREIKDRFYLG